jgi:tRNA (guanosine-2'-O-)-methyltransferase
MNRATKQALYDYLTECISDTRKQKFEENINWRTRYLTIAVEDIYQTHNASAVMRSAECMGIHDVHVIENVNQYRPNADIVMGANKWMNMIHYNGQEDNTLTCIQHLRKQGYRIVATTPHEKDCLIQDLPIEKGPMALFFGTEREGISQTVFEQADEFVKIPMVGFTESYNISVSAAICMYELMKRLRASDLHIGLSEEDMLDIKLSWVKATITRPDLIETEFFKNNPSL